MSRHTISEEYLNAFVDNQLEPEEKGMAFDAIGRDDNLRASVCELRELKEMIQHAYQSPPVRTRASEEKWRSRVQLQSLAACLLLLMVGGLSGWFISTLAESGTGHELGHLFQAISRSDSGSEPSKIMIYVGNANPVRLRTALDESESLLEDYRRDNQRLQLEIIANDAGVDLLRAGVSRYADRIATMQAKYPNLTLVACTQTLNKLQRRGIAVHLLPNIKSVSSAADEIRKRLKEGWDYVRV
ncbi:MAG TPA: hypothetical protein PLK99_02695 [Burkholderiales bacterium]|nr:hypothetical protein [Burkholderiales bacterium]